MLPGGIFNRSYKEDLSIVRTNLQWGLLIAFLVLLCLLPFFASSYALSVLIIIAITLIAVHGLNILMGYCGQINIANVTFMAVGAYTSANLVAKLGLPFWIALPCAGIVAGLVGVIFGSCAFRIKGLYLVMVTLAAHFIITYVIVNFHALTGGVVGINVPPPKLGPVVFDSDQSYYFLVMIAAILATIFTKNLVRSGIGRAFIAIRDNDRAAEAMGINVFYYKLLAFFIGCFYAGIAGSLFAHYARFINHEYFTLMDSVWQVGMLIIGGLGSCLGPVLGVILLIFLKEFITLIAPVIAGAFPAIGMVVFAALGMILFSVVLTLFLIFEPRGLAHRWGLIRASFRIWPFAY